MSSEAHSYFRYNTHLALVLVLIARAGPAGLGDRRRACPELAAAGRGGGHRFGPAGADRFAYRLRFDLVMPQPLVWDLAGKLKPFLKDGDRLALLLPGDNGSLADMLGGVLTDVAPRRHLTLLRRQTGDAAALPRRRSRVIRWR